MDKGYRITSLPIEDWKKYKELRLRSIAEDPQAFGSSLVSTEQQDDSRWKQRLERDPHVFLQDIQSEMLVGMAGSFSKDGQTFSINQMWIDPIARGKGLGTELLQAIVLESKNRGATRVELYVNTSQESAVALYKKLGFSIVRTENDVTMGDGSIVDEFVMELFV